MGTKKQPDLIDRSALGIGRCNPDVFPLQNRGYCAGWNGAINIIEQAPTVDAVEVVHGRWIWTESGEADYEQYWLCSECGDSTFFMTNYCPNCGADMRERKDNE